MAIGVLWSCMDFVHCGNHPDRWAFVPDSGVDNTSTRVNLVRLDAPHAVDTLCALLGVSRSQVESAEFPATAPPPWRHGHLLRPKEVVQSCESPKRAEDPQLATEYVEGSLASIQAVCSDVLWSGLHAPLYSPDTHGRRDNECSHGRGCALSGSLSWDPSVTCEGKTDLKVCFIVFQLLRALDRLHADGITYGKLHPLTVGLTPQLWLLLPLWPLLSKGTLLPALTPVSSRPLMQRWIEGDVSNFDYLMMINYAAGRRMGDASHHPILPWVTDFSSPDGSLRDLSKSKFRLHKGDAQLSMTFTTSTPQHHIPEPPLSDLTYFVYLARKVPMDVLKSQVRAEFRPAEYPTSMARMYSWSPDECIPEFFMDASVFVSHHTSVGLHDLELPVWCKTPEDFLEYHRSVLESDSVSAQLHLWIDLVFGVGLSGQAARDHLNVPLPTCHASLQSAPHATGFTQIFSSPHAQRWSAPAAFSEPALPVSTSWEFSLSAGFSSSVDLTVPGVIQQRHDPRKSPKTQDAIKMEPTLAPQFYPTDVSDDFVSRQHADVAAVGALTLHLYSTVSQLSRQGTVAVPDWIRGFVSTIQRKKGCTASEALAIGQSCQSSGADETKLTVLRPLPIGDRKPVRPVFPSYFSGLHEYLEAVYCAETALERATVALNRVKELFHLPLPAILLALPHLQALFADPNPATRAVMVLVWQQVVQAVPPHVVLSRMLPCFVSVYEAIRFPSPPEPCSESVTRLCQQLSGAESLVSLLSTIGADRFVSCVLPIILSWLLECPSPAAVRVELVHALACLCHPTALGPALTARFILLRLLHRCGKPDHTIPGEARPSYTLAAIAVISKRVSITLVESVVIPRLMFVMGSLLKQASTGEPDAFHISQKLDVKQQAHFRDVLACLATLIPRLSPTYIRTRVFGYPGSPFQCGHSPVLCALLASVGQLHTSASDTIPASLCDAIANAAASVCSAALKIAPTEPVKPLLHPVIMSAMKSLQSQSSVPALGALCPEVVTLVDSFHLKYKCLPLDFLMVLQKLGMDVPLSVTIPSLTASARAEAFFAKEFPPASLWRFVHTGSGPSTVTLSPQSFEDDCSRFPIASGSEWVWGAGCCGTTPWWQLGRHPNTAGTDDFPALSRSYPSSHKPDGLSHGHQSQSMAKSKQAQVANVAALLESIVPSSDGMMVDPFIADMLQKSKTQSQSDLGAAPHKSEEPTARRNLKSVFGGHTGAVPITLSTSAVSEATAPGSSGRADISVGEKPLPLQGEAVFVPDLDDGPSFMTAQLDVEKSRGGTTWRWRAADLIPEESAGAGGEWYGTRDPAMSEHGDVTAKGRASSGSKILTDGARPMFQVISRGHGVTSGDVRCMAVAGGQEHMLACGGQGGRVTLWNLDGTNAVRTSTGAVSPSKHSEVNPWRDQLCVMSTPHHYVSSLQFRNGGSHIVALGDGLSLWDVVTQRQLLSHDNASGTLVAMASSFVPCATWVSSSDEWASPFPSSTSCRDETVLFVASQSSVVCLDVRERWGLAAPLAEFREGLLDRLGTSGHGRVSPAAPEGHFGAIQCVATERYELYIGSSTGCVSVLDVRMGSVLHRWQAHDFPVVNLFPLSGDVLSVSGDHTAQLWPSKTWNNPVMDRKLLCKSVTSAPHAQTTIDDVVRDDAAPVASFPFQTPAKTRRDDGDELTSSGIAAYRSRTLGSASVRSKDATVASLSLKDVPPLPGPRGMRALSVGSLESETSSKVKSDACLDGVLGGGNTVSLWRPQGVHGSVHLLSADGPLVAVAPVKAGSKPASCKVFNIAEPTSGESDPKPLVGVKVKCVQVLPLRRLLLLGCDDGQVRVCGHVHTPKPHGEA